MMIFPDASIASKYLINTHMMVRVVAFHPEAQTVDVVQEVYDYVNTTEGDFVVQNEFGMDVPANVKELDMLYDIPVKQERYGQFSVRCCPKEGDTGYLEIFTEDLQDWFKNGGPSVPWAALRFLRKNSVFVPFVPNNKSAATDYPTTNDSFVVKSNRVTITVNDPDGEAESVNITMSNGVTLTLSADGSINATCKTATIKAETSATIDTPETTITGNTTINGTLQVDKEVTTSSTIESGGDITSGGDVISSTGKTLDTHVHSFPYSAGSTPATGTTNPPTA